jgi:hypothetical protein
MAKQALNQIIGCVKELTVSADWSPLLLKIAGKKEDLKVKYPQLSSDIDFFVQHDPSGSLRYLDYEVSVLSSGKALSQEISDVIQLFHKFQSNLDNKDIYSYKNFTELRDMLFLLKSQQEEKRNKAKDKYQVDQEAVTTGTELVFDNDQYRILYIKNKDAAIYHGMGTKWCISQKSANYFTQYDANNIVFFFIIDKQLDKDNAGYKIAQVYQRNVDNSILEIQYFDATDEQITPDIPQNILQKTANIAKSAPKSIVAKITTNEVSGEEVKKVMDMWRKEEDESSKNDYFYALVKNKEFIEILNTDRKLQLEAVKQNGHIIQYIRDPDKEVQLSAVKQDGWSIQWIQNPDKEVQLTAVKQDGLNIRFIQNPDKEVQLEAIKQNPKVVQWHPEKFDPDILESMDISPADDIVSQTRKEYPSDGSGTDAGPMMDNSRYFNYFFPDAENALGKSTKARMRVWNKLIKIASKYSDLQPDDIITVFHGTSESYLPMIRGIDATQDKYRNFGGPKHIGLFVSPSFDSARGFGGLVMELEVPASSLYGTDYSGRTAEIQKEQGESDPNELFKKYHPNSFRPYLSYTLSQSHEPQALFVGILKASQVKRIFWKNKWYSLEEFYESQPEYYPPYEQKPTSFKKISFDPTDGEISLDELNNILEREYGYSNAVNILKHYKDPDDLTQKIENLGWVHSAAKQLANKILEDSSDLVDVGTIDNYTGMSQFMNQPSGAPGAPNAAGPVMPASPNLSS